MHDIEPYYQWRDYYIAADDELSPFFGQESDEFQFTNKVYNYYIHPQWDEFGSSTLYLKVLFVDYEEGYAIIELIGAWNDTLHNDVMELERASLEQSMLQKQLEQMRKQNRQHQIAVQNYNVEQQVLDLVVVDIHGIITTTSSSSTSSRSRSTTRA